MNLRVESNVLYDVSTSIEWLWAVWCKRFKTQSMLWHNPWKGTKS